jgi:subtilisin family serine protease
VKNLIAAAILAFACGSLGTAQENGRGNPGGGQRFIVVLHDGVDVDTVIAEHGASADHVYKSALNGFAGALGVAAASALAEDPRVKSIEPDGEIKAIGQITPWGVTRVNAPSSSTHAGDGSGAFVNVGIAIIDTGVGPHPDLNIGGGVTFVSGKPTYSDLNGHGTHVAGTAAAIDNGTGVVGVAPGAKLWSVRVLGANGSGTTSGVIGGIDWVSTNASLKGIKVANMSLGGGVSSALDAAVSRSIAAGVTYCIAAGNSGVDVKDSSPARVAEAITVAASGTSDVNNPDNNYFASWSNWSANPDAVDLIAPGVNILSTWNNGGTNTISGTSMATPHCTGGAALFIASQSTPPTPAAVRDALVGAATKFVTGPDGRPYPLLNVSGF